MRIEVKGLNDVINFTLNLDKNQEKALDKGNEEFMKSVRRTSKFKAPRSSGELANGIRIEKTRKKGATNQWKLVSSVPYGLFVLEGRGPGKSPPIKELLNWNKLDRSKAGTTTDLGAAIVLGKHIANFGTVPNDFIQRAIEHNLARFDVIMKEALDSNIK